MKENKSSEKIKHFAKKKWDNFTDWFTDKEHPHSRLNKNVFFHDALKLIGLILVFLIIYSNLDKINQIVLIFIKLGSLLQLVLLFFILRKAWHLTINIKYAFRGLNHGTKAIIAIVIVLLLFMAFLNQDKVVNSITQTYEEANFSKLNPIQVSGNFSLGWLGDLKLSEASCPNFDIPFVMFKRGAVHDGWQIKGDDPGCKKGNMEGENLNHYYCGGFSGGVSLMPGVSPYGTQYAYIQKTTISDSGDIGKTYKHIIWNEYDENKEYLSTECLGDPDKFEEEQLEDVLGDMGRLSRLAGG